MGCRDFVSEKQTDGMHPTMLCKTLPNQLPNRCRLGPSKRASPKIAEVSREFGKLAVESRSYSISDFLYTLVELNILLISTAKPY